MHGHAASGDRSPTNPIVLPGLGLPDQAAPAWRRPQLLAAPARRISAPARPSRPWPLATTPASQRSLWVRRRSRHIRNRRMADQRGPAAAVESAPGSWISTSPRTSSSGSTSRTWTIQSSRRTPATLGSPPSRASARSSTTIRSTTVWISVSAASAAPTHRRCRRTSIKTPCSPSDGQRRRTRESAPAVVSRVSIPLSGCALRLRCV